MNLKNLAKKLIRIFPENISKNIYWYKNRITRSSKIKKWQAIGMPLPPPHQYKQLVIEQVAKKYNFKSFVETGTFMGHMVEAQRNNFERLYSVELDQTLYKNAKKRFSIYPHIEIILGNSAVKLPEILSKIKNASILFWLDGHYCGDNTGMGDKQCPVFEELQTIFDHGFNEKYILIDDARCFNGTNDYPTLDGLIEFIKRKDKDLSVEILNDIIHLY